MEHARVREASDEELVRRFRSGREREAAYMALYDRWGPLTLAFLRRRIGDPGRAEELNQDVWLAVLGALDRFRGDAAFKTWLFRMTRNRLLNLRRRWRTHLDETPDATPDELAHALADPDAESPDAAADRVRGARALRRCLAELPEVERAVIVGQYYEKITLAEMTTALELTNPSGARASLIAGQRKLRRCLERSGIDRTP